MKKKNVFTRLTPFELTLWISSVTLTAAAFLILQGGSVLELIASLIGVTALIFVAKGFVIGQVLTVVFACLYGIISFELRYYGEMITYLGMTAPIALLAAIEWLRNPYGKTREVKVRRLSAATYIWLFISAAAVTLTFFFILRALGNASIAVSTVSVTTSFLASALTFLRSPYYALAYSANDAVLIILWSVAALKDISCISMVICFACFLANDLYGFFNWRRMQKRQNS